MKYLLDTCVISDFVKGMPAVSARLLSIPPFEVALSSITMMEIEYGLLLNKNRARKLRKPLEALLQSVHLLPFTKEDAQTAADIRAFLKSKGQLIGAYDLLIAGCAKSRRLILVTSNISEFERVEDLEIENWRTPLP